MINNERLLKRFLDYIQIDSETGFERAIMERVQEDLRTAGIHAGQDGAGEKAESDGNNLYCFLEGDSSMEPLVFSAHLDTVAPGAGVIPVIENGIIRSGTETVLGGDDKCGVAAIVEALITLKEQGILHRPVEAVFTVREESGLRGSRHFDTSVLKSRMGVVLDSGGPVGTIITTAPGQLKIHAEVLGRRSHAGVAPEKGISSIQVLSTAISNMKLLRIDEETTANIGVIKADFPTNIVPDKAEMLAEARSISYDKLMAQGEHMKQCLEEACEKFGAKLQCEANTSYVGYDLPSDHPMITLVSRCCGKIGCEVVKKSTGGGSDANIFISKGIEMVNLGVGMTKVHSTQEELAVSDLEKCCELVFALMQGEV